MKYVVNWPARLEEMASFVGLTDEERQLIQDSGPLVMEHAEGLTNAVYDHFLKFPQARRFFVTDDDEVDEERLAKRKHTLIRWLRDTASSNLDESFAVHLLAMGISHGYPPTHRAHLGPVPSRYMIGTMSFAQTAIGDLLRRGDAGHRSGAADQHRLEQAAHGRVGRVARGLRHRTHALEQPIRRAIPHRMRNQFDLFRLFNSIYDNMRGAYSSLKGTILTA